MQSTNVPSLNQSKFEALFNHASMGIVIVDGKAIIQSVNPFALKLFGYTIEEVLNQPIELLIPKRYHDKHVQHRDSYMHHPKGRPMGVGMDLFAVRKDGSEFPVEVSLGNYSINEMPHAIAFISDISIRKKSEADIVQLNSDLEATVQKRTSELIETMQQLEKSKDELSKLLEKEKELGELKSRFVSMASHEFRTPLSTVLSSSYLIEKYPLTDDQPKREKHLQRIISSVNMLTDILNDFLSVGKIEEGKIIVRLSQFKIDDFIKLVIEEIKHNLRKGQSIRYEHTGASEVFLDPSMLKHIMMNLVSNASKFSPENSYIDIRSGADEAQVTISIKDYGMGISKEDQVHLMERFFRGANAANIQGTGLGLHIIAKYAELMNGTVSCKSALEEGTEFIVTFTQQPTL